MQLTSELPSTLLMLSSANVQSVVLTESVESKQWLFLPPETCNGLILQKPFYTDFLGPGAILSDRVDQGYKTTYPIGTVQLCVATTLEERQQAIQKRIAYSHRLAEIARLHAPTRRATLIVKQLCEWVGEKNANSVPTSLVAQLVGVTPKAIRIVWQQRADHCQCYVSMHSKVA